MTTFYLDLAGGNDGNAGTSFAARWKTITAGATAARIAPGDTIRLMESPQPTNLGINATWNRDSKTITLASALTANITDCETAWTASTNVTSTADTSTFKEGTKSAKHVIAAAFTTGKAAYFATGTLDLSAYQQVSFMIYSNLAVAANSYSLRLCSDTTGDTTVNTIPITVALPNSFGYWLPMTVDLGAALGSSIQSIALYCDLDPGTAILWLDNIIACKASSSADSLTLRSLLGKVWNLPWVASTSFATNDIRKPTQPNRNGFRYKVTAGGGGTSGGTEPTWPLDIGLTVVDGDLTWTCEGLEDTWYGIQSINGTTVKVDTWCGTKGNAGRGYSGDTETVATYKRECFTAMGVNGGTLHQTQEAGSVTAYTTYSGGWNSTDMTTQTGETWLDGTTGLGTLFNFGSYWNAFYNINSVRGNRGIEAGGTTNKYYNCHHNHHSTRGIDFSSGGSGAAVIAEGCVANNNYDGFNAETTGYAVYYSRCSSHGNDRWGFWTTTGGPGLVPHNHLHAFNNGFTGYGGTAYATVRINNYKSRSNGTGGTGVSGKVILVNADCTDSVPFNNGAGYSDAYTYSHRNGKVADAHLIQAGQGSIVSATDQRHTASGIAWKFRLTSTLAFPAFPLKLSVAKIAVAAGSEVSVRIWTRRDNTNAKGALVLHAGQLPGLGSEMRVACEPTINTWVESGPLLFTPTEAGVVEIYFYAWDGVGTTNNFWIDDLSVAQA